MLYSGVPVVLEAGDYECVRVEHVLATGELVAWLRGVGTGTARGYLLADASGATPFGEALEFSQGRLGEVLHGRRDRIPDFDAVAWRPFG